MSTVNFSVSEEVKKAFNETFQGQNKSAIIADLMREAVERTERRRRHHQAIARILDRGVNVPTVTEEDIRAAREEGRETWDQWFAGLGVSADFMVTRDQPADQERATT